MVSSKKVRNFAIANEAKDSLRYDAQVAELVDALVSKTNEVTLVPVRSRPRVLKGEKEIFLLFFYLYTEQTLANNYLTIKNYNLY